MNPGQTAHAFKAYPHISKQTTIVVNGGKGSK